MEFGILRNSDVFRARFGVLYLQRKKMREPKG